MNDNVTRLGVSFVSDDGNEEKVADFARLPPRLTLHDTEVSIQATSATIVHIFHQK